MRLATHGTWRKKANRTGDFTLVRKYLVITIIFLRLMQQVQLLSALEQQQY
jgi:hypothetical protein